MSYSGLKDKFRGKKAFKDMQNTLSIQSDQRGRREESWYSKERKREKL